MSIKKINKCRFSLQGGILTVGLAQLLQPETGTTDPRILPSRRMLRDALDRLLKKKEFEEISVQEIADDATLNRATFYLHYPDKNALLQAMTESRFRDLIERRDITFTDCNGALRAIALGVCDYRPQAVPVSWLGYRSKAPSSPSSRICSRKALPIMGLHPVPMRPCWRPPRPGPSLEPRAAGFRPPIVSPPRRWQRGLKPW